MRSTLIAAAMLAAASLTACLPAPPQPIPVAVAAQLRYACDAIHMPGNESNWCVTWRRTNGTLVTGPRARYNHEVSVGWVKR